MRAALFLLSALSAICVASAGGVKCSLGSGKSGECMDVSACESRKGKATRGLCPGPAHVQCCTDVGFASRFRDLGKNNDGGGDNDDVPLWRSAHNWFKKTVEFGSEESKGTSEPAKEEGESTGRGIVRSIWKYSPMGLGYRAGQHIRKKYEESRANEDSNANNNNNGNNVFNGGGNSFLKRDSGIPTRSPVGFYTKHDLEVFAKTLWGEARGEGNGGMIAVGWVIMNRTNSNRWPNSVAGVCKQKWQFSVWNPGSTLLSHATTSRSYPAVYKLAKDILDGKFIDPTGGSNHYYAYKVMGPPKWARGEKPVRTLGGHKFYKLFL